MPKFKPGWYVPRFGSTKAHYYYRVKNFGIIVMCGSTASLPGKPETNTENYCKICQRELEKEAKEDLVKQDQ